MRYWLMKSEPDEFSIDDLVMAKQQTTPWFGVRNYQARNYMRDDMRVGDKAFFYHSSCPEPGIAGIVEISRPMRRVCRRTNHATSARSGRMLVLLTTR